VIGRRSFASGLRRLRGGGDWGLARGGLKGLRLSVRVVWENGIEVCVMVRRMPSGGGRAGVLVGAGWILTGE
jgi:hypothetical protein